MNNATKLSAPWIEYFRKIQTMFQYDPEVHVSFVDDDIQIRIDNAIKADAISKLLPTEITFGNTTIKVTVIPANKEATKVELLRNAFNGNPIVTDIAEIGTMFGAFNIVMFAPKVAQYYNDNLTDPNGITTTLYQEIAKDLFGEDGSVYYCTEDARDTKD